MIQFELEFPEESLPVNCSECLFDNECTPEQKAKTKCNKFKLNDLPF